MIVTSTRYAFGVDAPQTRCRRILTPKMSCLWASATVPLPTTAPRCPRSPSSIRQARRWRDMAGVMNDGWIKLMISFMYIYWQLLQLLLFFPGSSNKLLPMLSLFKLHCQGAFPWTYNIFARAALGLMSGFSCLRDSLQQNLVYLS